MTAPDSAQDLLALPRAAVLMLWAAAYLRGDAGPDDAAELSLGVGHHAVGGAGEDLFDWMTGLRRLPLAQLRLVLPRPGRIAGLVGPPSALPAAIEAEQAVVVTAAGIADHTLVPEIEPVADRGRRGFEVSWSRFDAPLGQHVAPAAAGGAREELLRVLRRAAEGSVDLDLVPEEPVEAARIPSTWTATVLPRHLDPGDAHLLTLAARTLLLTRNELEDESSHTIGLSDALARRELLDELHDQSGAALVEAVERIMASEIS